MYSSFRIKDTSMAILGIGHKAQNGKDTLGEHFRNKYNFEVIHFADALKEESELLGWSPKDKNESAYSIINRLEKTIKKMNRVCKDKEILDKFEYLSIRLLSAMEIFGSPKKNSDVSFLQWYGTNICRSINEDYWVDKVCQKVSDIMSQGKMDICICDMRFINEFMAIKEIGGYTIDVRRFTEDYMPFIDSERDPNHPSEVTLDSIQHDFKIESTNLKHLYLQGDAILEYIGSKGS